jgi:hypothetical protein
MALLSDDEEYGATAPSLLSTAGEFLEKPADSTGASSSLSLSPEELSPSGSLPREVEVDGRTDKLLTSVDCSSELFEPSLSDEVDGSEDDPAEVFLVCSFSMFVGAGSLTEVPILWEVEPLESLGDEDISTLRDS